MNHGKSLRIFLRNGSVTGIRHAEVYNWTGQAIACPRKRLEDLKDWQEELPGTRSTGVYFLFGKQGDEDAVYIGESEKTLKRIGQHLPENDFWTEVVIFTSKDQNLTKAHIQYLEAELIKRANRTQRYELENSNHPSGASLAPAERAPMDEFIENMRLVLGALGYRLLEPMGQSAKSEETASKVEDDSPSDRSANSRLDTVFHFEPGEAEATGELTDEGFLIHEGSTATMSEASSLRSTYSRARNEMRENNQLKEDDNLYRFTEDVPCNSPSYAAAVVGGSPRNGREAWQDENGESIADLERQLSASLTEEDE